MNINSIISNVLRISNLIHLGSYVKTISFEQGNTSYTVELFRNPTQEEMNKISDEFGDVRGVILGKDLVVWSEDVGKHEHGQVEHGWIIREMNWTKFIPLVFNVKRKIVEISSWSISHRKDISVLQDKAKENDVIKNLGFEMK